MFPMLYFVVPGSLSLRTGGYHYDRRIIERLRARGMTVEVIELGGAYPFPSDSDRVFAARKFAAIPDSACVVIDGLAFGAIPEIAKKERERLRLIALVHHPLADETGLSDDLRRSLTDAETRALACSRRIIVTSAFTRHRLAAFGAAPEKVWVVEPGVEPAALAAGWEGGGFRLLCPASYTPRKGHSDLLKAVSEVADLDWTLKCVGDQTLDPAHFARLMELRDALGLAGRVSFDNRVDDAELNAIYAVSDAIVLASHYEGYGMVVTEALMRGLPVVTTTGGALAETLPKGAGLASPPGDVAAFSRNLRTLLGDPSAYRHLREAARGVRGELPNWTDSAEAFARALDGAI